MPLWVLVSFLPIANAANFLRVGLRSGRWGWFVWGGLYGAGQWHFLRALPRGALAGPGSPFTREFLAVRLHPWPIRWFLLFYAASLIHSLLCRRLAREAVVEGRFHPRSRSVGLMAGAGLCVFGLMALTIHGLSSRLHPLVRLSVVPLALYGLGQVLQGIGSPVTTWDGLPHFVPRRRGAPRWSRWVGTTLALATAVGVGWVGVGVGAEWARRALAAAAPGRGWAAALGGWPLDAAALTLGGTVGLLACHQLCRELYEEYDWFLDRNLQLVCRDRELRHAMGRIGRTIVWTRSHDVAARISAAGGATPPPPLPVADWKFAWDRGRVATKGAEAAVLKEVCRQVLESLRDPRDARKTVPYGQMVFRHLHPFADFCRTAIPRRLALAWAALAVAAVAWAWVKR